jgi:DNA replication protein DnaD
MTGWIKLHRKLLNSDMYRSLNSVQRDVMVQILLSANHRTNQWEWKGKLFECKPGQFITSLNTLKNNCASAVTVQNIRTALNKLKTWQFLTYKSTKTGRLITVLNWDTYQVLHEEDQQSNQQTANKELTTNKNDKEVKNLYSRFFEERWLEYPVKDGKKAAKKYFLSTVKTDTDLKDFDLALKKYFRHLEIESWKKPKNGKTFFNNWPDWINWKEPEAQRIDGVVL